MLLVDDRIGSNDLLEPLQQLGLDCDLQRLDFGDVAFVGRGMNGADVYIGIELKRTSDLIASLRSTRFAGHQLIGLQTMYDRAWLITEGIWRAGSEGVLEIMQGGWRPASIGKRPIMAADLETWLLTQVIRGGVQHWHCPTRRDTVRFISVLYHWWTRKDLNEHRSHQAIYVAPPDRASLIEPSTFVRMVAGIPKIGWDKAAALETACKGSIRILSRKSERDLQGIPGVGRTIAHAIHTALGADDDPSSDNVTQRKG